MIVVSVQLQYFPEMAPCFFQFTEGERTVAGMIAGDSIQWKDPKWEFAIDKEIAEELILVKFEMFLKENRDSHAVTVVG